MGLSTALEYKIWFLMLGLYVSLDSKHDFDVQIKKIKILTIKYGSTNS